MDFSPRGLNDDYNSGPATSRGGKYNVRAQDPPRGLPLRRGSSSKSTRQSQLHAHACNCSICYRSGGDQMIVPASRFRLTLRPRMPLTTYTFNTGAAQHTFCKHCGIKAFYTPRSNPDGFSVNLRCLDRTHVESIVVEIVLTVRTGSRMPGLWPTCLKMTNPD